MQQIVLATHNVGKQEEIQAVLGSTGVSWVLPQSIELSDVEETGTTFVENALIKARHATQETGLPALADDSGLVVSALGGRPGIYSARYVDPEASFEERMAHILQEMKDVPDGQRDACFVCVMVLLRSPDDPIPLILNGIWRGSILRSPQGDGGFGYDPIFWDPKRAVSAADLGLSDKNRVSHRGQALASLLAEWPEWAEESIAN